MRIRRLTDSIGYKLLASYILMILTPVLILGVYAYTSSVDYAREQTRLNIRATMQQMKNNVMYKTNEIKRLSDQIYNDQELQRLLAGNAKGLERYKLLVDQVKPILQRAIDQPSILTNMQIYLRNETFPEYNYSRKNQVEDPLNLLRRYEIFHLSDIEREAWYLEWKKATEERAVTDLVWKQVGSDKSFNNLSLLGYLYHFEKNEQIGLLKITADKSDIFGALDNASLGEGAALLVVDGDQNLLYSSDPKEWKEGAGTPRNRSSGYLKIEETIDETDWRLIAYIPNSKMEKNAERVRNLTIWISISSFILLLGVSAFISQSFSKRVNKIIASLNAYRGGETLKRIAFRGNDEFAQIAGAFNEMASNTNELINEVYVANLKKQKAELASLQAQINPHFLYNTLSSINRLAQFGQVDKLQEMVNGLAAFYRLSLNDGQTLISVGKELQQVQSYVNIQKIKYEDALEVLFEVDPDINAFATVKLILQPFVENALEHAWKGDHIFIHIVAYRAGETIVFNISDDGTGIAPETVNLIFNREGSGAGYGIRNVDDRIKLHFGKEYGVEIISTPGEGTTNQIVIPCTELTGQVVERKDSLGDKY